MPKPSTGRILTKRQEEIVALVAEGFSNKEVAENLNIGAGTVKVHLHKIFEALGIKSRRHLFNFSGGTAREARVGLLEPISAGTRRRLPCPTPLYVAAQLNSLAAERRPSWVSK